MSIYQDLEPHNGRVEYRPALVPGLPHGLIGLTKIWQNK